MNRSQYPVKSVCPRHDARTPESGLARLAVALKRAVLPGVFALAAISALPSQASQLVPQNLKQMIHAADVIVTGEVTKVTDGVENGLPFTEVTMKVNGSIKRDMAVNSDLHVPPVRPA